jgi:hypothetical protein
MDYQQGPQGLDFVYAIVAGLFAIVVAWKSFDYVMTEIRRRRENPPRDRDPRA